LAAAARATLDGAGAASSEGIVPAAPPAPTVTHEQAADWATWPLARPAGAAAAPLAPSSVPARERRRTKGVLMFGAIALGLLVVGAAVAVLVTRSSRSASPVAHTVPAPRTVVITNPTSPTQVRTVTVPVSNGGTHPSSPAPPPSPTPQLSDSPVATLATRSYSVSYPSSLMSPTSDRDSYKGRDSDGPRYNTEVSSPDASWDLVVDRIPGDPHDAISKARELTTKYITPANGFNILSGPTGTQVSGIPAAQFAYTTTKFPGYAVEDTFVIGNDSFAVRGRAPTLADARQLTDLAAGSLLPNQG
jgi:hypothetical protein